MLEGSRHQRSVAEMRAGEELLLGIGHSANLSPFGLLCCVFSLLLGHASLIKNQRFLLSCFFTVPTRHLPLQKSKTNKLEALLG